MAEKPESSAQDPHDEDEALKKRLISRIAVAGVVVVALLGGLALVDALYGPQHKAPPTEEAPAGKAPEAGQPPEDNILSYVAPDGAEFFATAARPFCGSRIGYGFGCSRPGGRLECLHA